jgi:lipoic acid synthetase
LDFDQQNENSPIKPLKKPDWLRIHVSAGQASENIRGLLEELHLNTVCEQAGCPNCSECFGRGTAAFLIMGSICSRSCRFCQVSHGCPQPLDPSEPAHLAEAILAMKLRHVVVTSVTRDDLPDGGAGHFAAVIREIKRRCDGQVPVIEVLIPDFQGDWTALKTVIEAGPDILNHNIETVPRLYPSVRPQADDRRSLDLLKQAKLLSPKTLTKSGLMAGLGESRKEVLDTLRDLRDSHCDLLTIGQYLAPSRQHLPVVEYVHPDIFEWYRKQAIDMGFLAVASGPLVRSSYMAEQLYKESQ